MIASFFKYLVIGIVALLALKVALAVVGIGIALITLAIPIAIVGAIGYGVFKLIAPRPAKQISDADRKWLES